MGPASIMARFPTRRFQLKASLRFVVVLLAVVVPICSLDIHAWQAAMELHDTTCRDTQGSSLKSSAVIKQCRAAHMSISCFRVGRLFFVWRLGRLIATGLPRQLPLQTSPNAPAPACTDLNVRAHWYLTRYIDTINSVV